MLAKKTSKNQVTLPKKALQDIPETDYFDVTAKEGVLILKPVTVTEPGSRLATVRQKIKDLGIVISALLFSGPPSQLISAWQSGRLRPVVSAQILEEYLRVPAYLKFDLTSGEIRGLIEEELLPFIETAKAPPSTIPKLRDPDDSKFVTCAMTARVRWLVSGNDDLLSLHRIQLVEIVSVSVFLQHLRRKA